MSEPKADPRGAVRIESPVAEPEAIHDPIAIGEAAEAGTEATAPVPVSGGDASLLALVDRLTTILERSELIELEVEAGGTALVLRKPEAIAAPPPGAATPAPSSAAPSGSVAGPSGAGRPAIAAPLTGIWYRSPSPGSPPFIEVGQEVATGQVVGLIEAMKLFNEIKSDRSGRVAKVLAESGQLVKARQPLIEVEPL